MNWIKNKWVWITITVLLLVTMGFAFRKQIGPWFGGFEKSERGFYYRFTKGKKLNKTQGPGFHIIYQYLVIGPAGDTLRNEAKEGVELERKYPVEATNEIEDAMQLASPGSIVEILVPTDTMLARNPTSLQEMNLPTGKNVKFVIHVIKLLNEEEFEGYRNQRYMARLAKENKAIDDFAAKVKQTWVLDSFKFIKYYITDKTDKERLKTGDEVEFNADVYTLDGNMIRSSMGGKKYKVIVGRDQLELAAFDASLVYLAEGESGFFLVTSDYGFGSEGIEKVVKPYTPLAVKIYDLKLLNKK